MTSTCIYIYIYILYVYIHIHIHTYTYTYIYVPDFILNWGYILANAYCFIFGMKTFVHRFYMQICTHTFREWDSHQLWTKSLSCLSMKQHISPHTQMKSWIHRLSASEFLKKHPIRHEIMIEKHNPTDFPFSLCFLSEQPVLAVWMIPLSQFH